MGRVREHIVGSLLFSTTSLTQNMFNEKFIATIFYDKFVVAYSMINSRQPLSTISSSWPFYDKFAATFFDDKFDAAYSTISSRQPLV